VAEEIQASGGNAITVDLDVTDPAQVDRMLESVTERLGPVGILSTMLASVTTGRPPRCRWKSGTTSST
jgi:NAD(P)-dependent dehydrogenase (short-subunit alcohol dehydrogenase family)